MKNILFSLIILFSVTACNNTGKKTEAHNGQGDAPTTQTDSLLKDIDEGHIVGMSKIGKIHITEKQVQALIDSIAKLPAKTQQAAATYVEGLKNVIKDLGYADMAMDKWMMEYDEDSVKDNLEQRLRYLTEEKLKVSKMKEAILTSLQKADSLLKAKW